MAEQWREFAKETVALAGSNFIEVKLSSPPDGDKLFVGISKGWQTEGGDRRYKSNVTVPVEKAPEVVAALQKMVDESRKAAKA
jgi:hypothetical protein